MWFSTQNSKFMVENRVFPNNPQTHRDSKNKSANSLCQMMPNVVFPKHPQIHCEPYGFPQKPTSLWKIWPLSKNNKLTVQNTFKKQNSKFIVKTFFPQKQQIHCNTYGFLKQTSKLIVTNIVFKQKQQNHCIHM